MVRKSDLRVNATQILRAAGQNVDRIRKIRSDNNAAFDTIRGNAQHQGTYVDLRVGVELCEKYGLVELTGRLRHLQDESRSLLQQGERPNCDEHVSRAPYVEIGDLTEPVMIRTSDSRVNATHILKLADQPRRFGGRIRQNLASEAYDIIESISYKVARLEQGYHVISSVA